jgi:hypothetical protein
MTLNDFRARLKGGKVDGWYIFAGEEDYLKRHYRGELSRAVLTDEAFDMFNHALFDGQEFNIAAFRDALYAPPMMADYKLIEWRHADLDKMKESDRALLLELLEAREDYPYAVVAITALSDGFDTGTDKRPSKLYTKLSSGFDILVFDKSTDAQLLSWLKKHFDAEDIAVDVPTVQAMLFRVGHSMQVLANELSAEIRAKGYDPNVLIQNNGDQLEAVAQEIVAEKYFSDKVSIQDVMLSVSGSYMQGLDGADNLATYMKDAADAISDNYFFMAVVNELQATWEESKK